MQQPLGLPTDDAGRGGAATALMAELALSGGKELDATLEPVEPVPLVRAGLQTPCRA